MPPTPAYQTLLTLMRDRRSIRRFKAAPLPDGTLELLLEAARWAPSASNRQAFRFLAVEDPSALARMAEQTRAENLKAALLDLPPLLEKIWSGTQYPPAERRRLLHELWREYAEMPGTAPSCATILGFIRRRLPAGSPNAYTADELAHLRPDAGPRFDPYGP